MRTQRLCTALTILFLALSPFGKATAEIVISELLWSGSDLSSADEWIEIANTGTGALSLSGWTLTKFSDGSEEDMLTFPAGSIIGSGGTFLLSNFDEQHSRLGIIPDLVDASLTLSNTQLLLRLYAPGENGSGRILIDEVDDGVGEPFAGSNALPKASMERISLTGSGQLKANWKTAATFINLDDGAPLFGTPRALNGTGAALDIFPPKDSTLFTAEYKKDGSGVLLVSFIPSTSLDLASQHLFFSPPIGGSSGITLPASATGVTFTENIGTGTGILFLLQSRDILGNTSSGVTTISRFIPEVRITEVLSNPKGADDNEWIELGNFGSEIVDIGGWLLDEENSAASFVIPSPLLLAAGEHRSFRKSETGLPLDNQGETVSLTRGLTVMDSWTYRGTAEDVSYGLAPRLVPRSPEGEVGSSTGSSEVGFQSFCIATEGQPNAVLPRDPQIRIQSGETTGEKKVTLNLITEIPAGSTADARCHWEYGDGFMSESCNPPSHTFDEQGTYIIRLTYGDSCGNSAERELTAVVTGIHSQTNDNGGGGSGGGGTRSGGGGGGGPTSCTPSAFSGIRISEALPNPEGDDADGEWIELENTSDEALSLCGWHLDDGEEGSAARRLDPFIIPGHGLLLLPRSETKLALNNDEEHVRLFAPGMSLLENIPMTGGREGESFALRPDGLFVWTPYPTPGAANRFRTFEKLPGGAELLLSAVLPNPEGPDEGNEWVEITNVGKSSVNLSGWFLDDSDGGSKPYEIKDIILAPGAVKRFLSAETKIGFTNTGESARLLDPTGAVISILSWHDAVSGRVYHPAPQGKRIAAKVLRVIDGDTLEVEIGGKKEHVRMIGIDTPETVHPEKAVERFGKEASAFTKSLLEGKDVLLEFDTEERDKYDRLLAYVLLPDPSDPARAGGTNVNGELVRRGYAYVYLRFPFSLSTLFAEYEREAKIAKIGLWADTEAAAFIEKLLSEEKLLEATETGAYVIPEKAFTLDVLFSEIMSNPPLEGPLHDLGEYIELWNPTGSSVSLEGWILDDASGSSSKPRTLSVEILIPAGGYLLLPSTETDITLNNEGETLSLTSPDGKVSTSVIYPKMKRSEAYAFTEECLTSLPTPGEENICQEPIAPLKKSVTKKVKTGGVVAQSVAGVRQPVVSLSNHGVPLQGLRTKYRSPIPAQKVQSEKKPLPHLLAALLPQIERVDFPPELLGTGKASPSREVSAIVVSSLLFMSLLSTAGAKNMLY